MTEFSQKICVACQPDAEPASAAELADFLAKNPNWALTYRDNVKRIERSYNFKNFQDALTFTNAVGEVAEQEGHHPSIQTEWGKVIVIWWSHKIADLHLNDLILAARCDRRYDLEMAKQPV